MEKRKNENIIDETEERIYYESIERKENLDISTEIMEWAKSDFEVEERPVVESEKVTPCDLELQEICLNVIGAMHGLIEALSMTIPKETEEIIDNNSLSDEEDEFDG